MRRSALASLFMVMLFAEGDSRAQASCPPPTEPQGGLCVLDKDETLTQTMSLPSGTHLNCQGHRLTSASPGVLDDPRTGGVNEFDESTPELAILVHRADGVKIQNCLITGFDFGIIVAQSKIPDAPPGAGPIGNKIVANVINVRTNAIDVIKSDNVLITGNELTYASERGRGIVIDYDSDDNQVIGNHIVSTDAASTGQVRQVPGGPFVTSTAIMDNEIHLLQGDRPLQNLVINGVLIQVPGGDRLSDFEDSHRSDHNLVAENIVVDLGAGSSCTLDPGTTCRSDADCAGKGVCLLKQNSGVGFNIRASDTVVRGNQLSGQMDRGISFGGVPAVMTIPNWYPGTCSLDSARMCTINSDCNIPGYDTMSLGVCVGFSPETLNGNTLRLTAEDNVLKGNFDTAGFFANNTDQFAFRRNTIDGGASGIRVSNLAINGIAERNIVSSALNALHLGFQSPFTNRISLNDFTGYSVAIRTTNDFNTLTDISAGTGNYWGLPCPGFDSSLVRYENGSINPNVYDGRPYGVSVALTPDKKLPKQCQ